MWFEDLPEWAPGDGCEGTRAGGSGGIHRASAWWMANIDDPLVRRWVQDGVFLDWLDKSTIPPPVVLNNHGSADRHRDFVSQCVNDLLDAKACMRWTGRTPRCVNPLGVVPKKGGKLRLILDLPSRQ